MADPTQPVVSKTENLVRLNEVHKRTGLKPNSMRVKKNRGILPFPLFMDDEGRLVARESDVQGYIEKVIARGPAK